jgi:hypothetical protein
MSVGAPLITHAHPDVQRKIYREAPPLLHVERNVDSVLGQLRACLGMSHHELRSLGIRGREWILRECDYRAVVPRYIALHQETTDCTSIRLRVPVEYWKQSTNA